MEELMAIVTAVIVTLACGLLGMNIVLTVAEEHEKRQKKKKKGEKKDDEGRS